MLLWKGSRRCSGRKSVSEPARRVLIDLDLDEQRGDIVIMDSLLVHKAPAC